MKSITHNTDVVIVGAGPAGLFAVFECGMLKMRCHVVDSLPHTGGQCSALYPEKPIYDIPGYPAILAQELIARLEEQAEPFSPVYHLGQTVTGLDRTDGGFALTTSQGNRIECRAVILAAGPGAFGPNRPPLAGIEAFENRSVFYSVRDKGALAGKKLAIAGGGDSAVDWALALAPIAGHIWFIHRRAKFRAAPQSVEQLEKLAADGKIEMVVPFQLAGVQGQDGLLSGVEVEHAETGERKKLDADVLLPFFGLSAALGPIAQWGLDLAQHHVKVSPTTCATSIPGVFAIGDVAAYPDKLKLILTGFAEAASAAHAIHPLVFPGQALHFEYSTTKGIP